MGRFLFLTDLHLMARTPARRTGNFENDVMGKLAWALITAHERDVDAIVCGGDLFDLPRPSYRLAVRVMKLIREAGLPWLHVLGNHDIMGHNPDTYTHGALAFLEQLPNFQILNDYELGGHVLRAVHYRHGVEELTDWSPLGEKPEVVFAHAMITPGQTPFAHVLPKDIKTRARLVLCGHYHDPWGYVTAHKEIEPQAQQVLAEGIQNLLRCTSEERLLLLQPDDFTVFLNPGSMARISYLAHNLGRTPRAFIVEVGEAVQVTAVPVPVARPAAEAFDEGAALAQRSWDISVQEFLAAMENVKVEGVQAADVVISAAKARAGVESIEELPQDGRVILDHALEAVAAAEATESEEA
jgi:hypothetical protein